MARDKLGELVNELIGLKLIIALGPLAKAFAKSEEEARDLTNSIEGAKPKVEKFIQKLNKFGSGELTLESD